MNSEPNLYRGTTNMNYLPISHTNLFSLICEWILMELRELRTEAVQRHYECKQTRKSAKLITNFNSLKKFDEIGWIANRSCTKVLRVWVNTRFREFIKEFLLYRLHIL